MATGDALWQVPAPPQARLSVDKLGTPQSAVVTNPAPAQTGEVPAHAPDPKVRRPLWIWVITQAQHA